MSSVRKCKGKPTARQVPDLQPILDAYLDAYALLHTASHALHNGDENDKGEATTTLRQGVEALDAANESPRTGGNTTQSPGVRQGGGP